MEGQFISPEGAWPQAIGYLFLFLVKLWNENWKRHDIFLNNRTDFHNSFNISVSTNKQEKLEIASLNQIFITFRMLFTINVDF